MKFVNLGGNLVAGPLGLRIEAVADSSYGCPRPVGVSLSHSLQGSIPEKAYLLTVPSKKGCKPAFILFEAKKRWALRDPRVLVVGNFHKFTSTPVRLDTNLTTATILEESRGGGPEGGGVAFLAILRPGQMVVSQLMYYRAKVLWLENDEVKFGLLTWPEIRQLREQLKGKASEPKFVLAPRAFG